VSQDIFGPDSLWSNRAFLQFFFTTVILIPLSLWPRILDLGWISFMSLLVSELFVAIVVYRFIVDTLRGDILSVGDIDYFSLNVESLQSFGVMIIAFNAHTNLLPVTAELKDSSITNVGKVVNISTSISLFSYLFCGIFGYLTFRDETGNLN
jgi:amino acid permease